MPWLGEKELNQMRQLLGFDGLVALHAAPPSNLAHGVGRDIAGQNDSGDLAAHGFAHAGDDLEAGQAVWQTVVGDDKIGPCRSRQRQRLLAVPGGGSPITLVPKEEIKQLTHRWIVLNDQNPGIGRRALYRVPSARSGWRSRFLARERSLDGED